MPTASVHQVRAAIEALRQKHPDRGKKKLCEMLNKENNLNMTNKEFRQHLRALEPEAQPPSPEIVYATIKALRITNPTAGVKKFAGMLNTINGWSLSTKEVREYLGEVNLEMSSD